MIKLNELPSTGNKKPKRRRGSTTQGRGTKGQLSRSGSGLTVRKSAPGYIIQMPKIGFVSLKSLRKEKAVLSLNAISKLCKSGTLEKGEKVTKETLIAKKIIKNCKFLKIISSENVEDIKIASIEVDAISESAEKKLKDLKVSVKVNKKLA